LNLELSGPLHLLINECLPLHQLIVLSLQVLKPVLQSLDVCKLPLLRRSSPRLPARLVLHDGVEEVVELLELSLLLLLPLQVVLGLLELDLELFDLRVLLLDDPVLVL
jgi:hypothetical protein